MNIKSFLLVLLVVATAFTTGCTPEPEIVRHSIPKSRSGLDELRAKQTAKNAPKSAPTTTRMSVAMFDQPDATWYVKIVGPAELVDATENQWRPFFDKIKFEDGKPTWELPKDWKVSGPKPMRFETLVIGDYQPPLEVAISSLGPNQDLLLNVNRWRVQQLGLPPATPDNVEAMVEKKKSEFTEYMIFDALGTGSGRMTPPFAGGGAPFAGGGAPFSGNASATPSSGARRGPDSPLTYKAPDGWTEGKASSIVHARLKTKASDATAQITIIELTPNNEWDPNVERWAKEVGMEGLSQEQFAERTKDISVDGITGQLVDLVDLESENPNGTIAGMFKHQGSAWFLKLTGDKQLVNESRETFDKFIDSIQFKK